MRRLPPAAIVMFVATACGSSPSAEPDTRAEVGSESTSGSERAVEASEQGSEEPAQGGGAAPSNQFQLQRSDDAERAHGERPSQIVATATEAAMRLFVVDPETGPIQGIVIKMTAPDGATYYTGETDSHGYAEVLVPVGRRYEIEYLSLGRRNTTASVEVPEGPNQDIRLTMRYRRLRGQSQEEQGGRQRAILEGVLFESNSATIQRESHPRLDRVVEYLTHKRSARIRVEGHTDSLGNARRNLALSEARARAVRDYLVSRGIDPSRIEAVGYGDQRPIAPNDTEEGRRQNRRIEAIEL